MFVSKVKAPLCAVAALVLTAVLSWGFSEGTQVAMSRGDVSVATQVASAAASALVR
jgi:hypothetical protein